MPTEHFLNGFWSDVLSILGLIGLAVTFYQVWLTKNATEAALDAINEAKGRYIEFLKHQGNRHFNEAKNHIKNSSYDLASVRLGDLAEALAQIGETERAFSILAQEVHDASLTFHRIHISEIQFANTAKRKWWTLSSRLFQQLSQNPINGISQS